MESGTYDAGVLDEQVWRSRLAEGTVDTAAVRVLWTTPAFPAHQWVLGPTAVEDLGADLPARDDSGSRRCDADRVSAPPGPSSRSAPGDPGTEVDLDAPPPAPAPPPALTPRRAARRRSRRRGLAAAAVVLVLGAGWAASRSGEQDQRPGAPAATSTEDAARLRRLFAVDSTARRLGATDPRMIAARRVEDDCARAAGAAPAPDQALQACKAQFDVVQARVWADAHARALASASSGSPP